MIAVFESLVTTSGISVLERVIAFTGARHDLLANNIANIDTPDYKMKDLDVDAFNRDLCDAVNARTVGPGEPKVDDEQYLLFHDGNNRSVEKQMTEITKNTMLHNAALEILRNQYQVLSRAIAGQV